MRRRWITVVAFLFLALTQRVDAQNPDNMVFNPSFEEHTRCPERIDAMGIMSGVEAWWQPTAGSSDYFHACGGRECMVPRNKMGFQEAHTGEAYCGIYCSQESYREYLQTELKSPLQAGRRYRVSFYVSLADKSSHAVATLGALFSAERPTDSSWEILMNREVTDYGDSRSQSIAVFYVPQVQNSVDSVLSQNNEWMEVSGEFVAAGGERFLTIGNFNSFNHSNVVFTESTNAVLQGAYYYIDDVSVVCLEENQMKTSSVAIVPTEGDVVPMWGVLFAVGDSEILPQSYNELHRLVALLEAHPSMRIELRGHTDNQGTTAFNQRLSEARALAVLEYLAAHGIDRRRMTATGYGKTMPLESNETSEGRGRNRRVEYRVISN